jgi:bifunctional DNA-binding transcriptional regulator/antitoxin component of YhaV-PrlF toxin-antitoxin module
MTYEFDSEIKMLEGKIKWPVFYFPYSAMEEFGAKGNIPVLITVDGHEFEHTMLGSRNGHYMVYNQFIRRAVGKDLGDTVHVTLTKDERKRELMIPEYILARLTAEGVMDAFNKQPPYLRREQVNNVEVAKKDEVKSNRLDKLVRILKGELAR